MRGRVDIPDAVLLGIGFAIVLFFFARFDQRFIIAGAAIAYPLLIVALVILPRLWATNDRHASR